MCLLKNFLDYHKCVFPHLPFQKVRLYYPQTRLHDTAVHPSGLFPKYDSLKQNINIIIKIQSHNPPTPAFKIFVSLKSSHILHNIHAPIIDWSIYFVNKYLLSMHISSIP
jgi:hypothetical protein